jgi:hypothetical protein
MRANDAFCDVHIYRLLATISETMGQAPLLVVVSV